MAWMRRQFLWRPRLGLRTLFALIALLAVWLGWNVERARRQASAVKALGARMTVWDHELPSGDVSRWSPAASPKGPAWLRGGVNFGLFNPVRGVILVHQRVRDALPRLADLPRLLILNLSGSDADDQGLRHVGRLVELQSLNLDWTPVTDAGLEELTGLTQLHSLWLNETDVTDVGLIHLAKLKSLRRLYLEGTAVTAAGVEQLRQSLPRCDIWWGLASSPQSEPGRPL